MIPKPAFLMKDPKNQNGSEKINSVTSDVISLLPQVRGTYRENADLSKTTWFRSGGPAQVLFKPADVDDLQSFLKNKPANIPVEILGVGSNLLVRDGGIPGVVIRLGRGFTNVAIHGDFIDIGAGMLDGQLANLAADEGFEGLEFLAGIPGTIGGALRMNAGCYGREIKDIIEGAFVIDPKGNLHHLTVNEMDYSYRHCGVPKHWIFVGARFKISKVNENKGNGEIKARMMKLLGEREETQPTKERTGGSTFANPEGKSAWKLIDAAGCRGLKHGGAMVSEKHCNFLINFDNATSSDLEELGDMVKEKVLNHSGVKLRWEIQKVGDFLESSSLRKKFKKAA